MSRLELTMATSYYEHVAELTSGRVRPDGITLRCLDRSVEDIFQRFLRFREWDVSEFSMAGYTTLVAAGDRSMVGLPIFPSRVFRHSSVYVRAGELTVPGMLAGRRIGVPEWAQTAAVYARALLVHEWGIGLTDVEWVQAGVNQPGRKEKAQVTLPQGVRLTRAPDRSLDEMLLAGDIDAIFSAHPPASYEAGDARVVRLIADTAEAEREYGRRTGIVPIMHLVVVRREVVERDPWVVSSLMAAFAQARAASLAHLARGPGGPGSRVPLRWTDQALARTAEVFGGEPWPYGVEANRVTLEAFLRWSHEQGVTPRAVALEEMFDDAAQFAPRV
jgi:4,5-dihydroxyphthalate decarboxylase